MAVYNFPTFSLETQYPESSQKMSFGKGWEFASRPKGPDQTIYVLHYAGMMYFINSSGDVSLGIRPTINIHALDAFYKEHRMWKIFDFPHPDGRTLQCRFHKPLQWKIKEGGRGLVEPFTVQLILQPR